MGNRKHLFSKAILIFENLERFKIHNPVSLRNFRLYYEQFDRFCFLIYLIYLYYYNPDFKYIIIKYF